MEKLPEKYLSEARSLFKDDFDDYLNCFSSIQMNGLRINTQKISVGDFLKISPFRLEPIPWTSDGFYFDQEERPAKHPYYYAGLYYIQEPSAMLPAEVLPIKENDIVLDACPLDLAQIDNIKVGAVKDGLCTVTFDSEAGPFSYTLDAVTGEIVDKVEPEVTAEVQAHDPTEEAINACMDSIEGYSGGAENIKVKFVTVDGVEQIEVELDWNGEHYDMFYDPAAGQIVS